jgi:hypothetical protein
MTSTLDGRERAGRRTWWTCTRTEAGRFEWWAGRVIAVVLLAIVVAGFLTGHGGQALTNAGVLAAVSAGAASGTSAWRGWCRRR